ncbi:MAG TPA: metal-sulfur cluster assembly factor [Candidatus Limnocylindria bacterium]|nr:metal-sulfur cluster assembly factor [Candidatus Limnocylindria bacterium]
MTTEHLTDAGAGTSVASGSPDEPMSVSGLLGMTVEPEAISEALRAVIDPELGVNIIDLGLVYNAEVVDGRASILITTTTPACPLGPYLSDGIRWALLKLNGILDVDIEVTYDPLWSPDLMTDVAKAQLGWRG